MDRLQARILRDIAQQDQQRAAQRDGHVCDYDCDCEQWIELPNCCSRPAKPYIARNYVKPDPEPGCAGAVFGLVLVAWLGTWLFSMWLAGGAW